MKLVGLVSGGKDSCYSMVQCVTCGHEIVALAHLSPGDQEELDSFMYQSVGHDAMKFFAEAMGVPLYQRVTKGKAVCSSSDYQKTQDDEVEDLYDLLKTVKDKENVEGISSGAILSNYQRVRVENVCSRLGLTSYSYLWRRDQEELLSEMLASHMHAIIIKVATLGLYPNQHLGKEMSEVFPHLIQMNRKYGLNICGEGGEYETFTLDCPLFKKRIVVDEEKTVILNDNDTIAPVGYIKFRKLHLESKPEFECLSQRERIQEIGDFRPDNIVSYLNFDIPSKINATSFGLYTSDKMDNCIFRQDPVDLSLNFVSSSSGWFWISNLIASQGGPLESMKAVLELLKDTLSQKGVSMSDLVSVQMYVNNMQEFVILNNAYKLFFDFNPPSRVCVQVPLPDNIRLILHCSGYRNNGQDLSKNHKVSHMHVQSVSHWAPANIGPYSQAVQAGDFIYVAGQIALVPESMQMIEGGVVPQCLLSLRHVQRVLKAMDSNCDLANVVICICYVTHKCYGDAASEEWYRAVSNFSADIPVFTCVIVPGLPRDALIEWQIVTHSRHPTEWQWNELNQWEVDETCVRSYLGMCKTDSYCSGVLISKCVLTDGVELTEHTLHKVFTHLLSTIHNCYADVCIHFQLYYTITRVKPIHIQNAWGRLNNKSGFSLIPVLGHSDDSCVLSMFARFC